MKFDCCMAAIRSTISRVTWRRSVAEVGLWRHYKGSFAHLCRRVTCISRAMGKRIGEMTREGDGGWADHLREGHQDEDGTMTLGTLSEPRAVELRCATTDLGVKLIDEKVDVVSLSTTGFE